MRRAFVQTLAELAGQDARIVLLTADLGFMALEPFIEKHPARFFNMGVAEQNAVGVATGLAEAGFLPFVYSIATFATMRPYEFIRNGPILHQLPVRIVGIGGGVEYGTAGLTHHGVEDVGLMRLQPGITVVVPADFRQAQAAILSTWDMPGPIYYRFGKNDAVTVPELNGHFELGRIQVTREGEDILLISMGAITSEVAKAAETLAAQGISATVAIVSSFNPAPTSDLARLLARFPLAITIETHYITGGLGSLVCEIVAEAGLNCRVIRCGVEKPSEHLSGGQEHLQHMYGVSSNALIETVMSVMSSYRK